MPHCSPGEIITVTVRLEGRETDLFPKAVIKDELGAVISTVSLVSVGDGSYQDRSVVFAGNFMRAEVDIYEDALHTVRSRIYPDAMAIGFYRDKIYDLIISEVINVIAGLSLPGASINAKLVQQVVDSVVKDVSQAKADISPEEIAANLSQSNDKALPVSENEIATTKC